MRPKIVHYVALRMNHNAWAACSGWMKVPYTLLPSAVTCKLCRRMKVWKAAFEKEQAKCSAR